MIGSKTLFDVLGINKNNISAISAKTGISKPQLVYYNEERKFPLGNDLHSICAYFDKTELWLKLKLGCIDSQILDLLSEYPDTLSDHILNIPPVEKTKTCSPDFSTTKGKLFQTDCISFLHSVPDNSYDLIFADPPFNLNKLYPSKMNDSLKEEEYIHWQELWVLECIRVLKTGGSFFLWNLPKWNTYLTMVLNNHLTFKHWISVDIKYSLPIAGRLYPSHYSLLYYTKGKRPNTFHPDRLPMEICPNCYTDLVDYGGYKDKMNPLGVNLSDVWYDIPPVRHNKYKRRKGANELSIKLLDRIIEMASNEGDLIFDPFGGSGTTYIVAEIKNRNWIGTEIGPLTDIIERFSLIDTETEILNKFRENLNTLFSRNAIKARKEKGLWTPESVRKEKHNANQLFDFSAPEGSI